MLRPTSTHLIFSALLLAGCASTEPLADSQNGTAATAPSVQVWNDEGARTAILDPVAGPTEARRPLPYPVTPDQAWLAAVESGTRTLTGEPGEAYWTNRAEYRLAARLDVENRSLEGTGTIVYHNQSPDPMPVIVLELAQNLHKPGTIKYEAVEVTSGVELTSVSADGRPMPETTLEAQYMGGESGYLVDGTLMAVFPERMVQPGERIELEISWQFDIPQQGASGRMGWSRDNLFYLGYWYPHMAVYDDVIGWLEDPFTGQAEFYHGFADYEIEITAPEGWLVMSTGAFLNPEQTLAPDVLQRYGRAGQSDTVVTIVGPGQFEQATLDAPDGELVWRFRAENVRDVAFSATRESVWDGTRSNVGDLDGDGMDDYTRIHTFWRESAPLWSDQARYAKHSIEFLSRSIAHPYPWPHMTSVEGEDIIGGGMEFPMMTIIGPYTSRGAEALYSVTAHELAHMWFPMIVSTNERRYSWMDEGTTDFNTHFSESDFYPGLYDNTNLFDGYLRIAGTDYEGEMMRWSDHHYFPFAFGIASYSKPAAVLMALKTVLGEEVFTRAYHAYMERWAYKHPYPWDLWNTFEDVSGQDLDWFWRSWYHETWVLDHAVAGVSDGPSGGVQVITIRDEGSVVMPVDVRITYADGRTEDRRISHEIWLEGSRTARLMVEGSSEIRRVEIDPDLGVPDADRTNNTWTFRP